MIASLSHKTTRILLLFCALTCFGQTAIYEKALAAFRTKQYTEAAQLFGQAELESPGQTDSLLYQGKALANAGRFAEAEKSLRQMIERHPESVDGLAFLGYVLNRENKVADSLEYYNLAAKLAIPAADDLKIVALDYVILNDIPSAIRWLTKAVELDPRNAECHYFLGRVYFEAGRFREAKPELLRALELNPRYGKAEDYLGLILRSENDKTGAEQSFKNAIIWERRDGRETEHSYLHLADLYDSEDRDADALALLTEAKRIAPGSALVRDRLGRVYLHLGQTQAACRELERATTIDPNNASVHYLLGRAYKQLGMQEKAKDEFRHAQELFGTSQGPNQ